MENYTIPPEAISHGSNGKELYWYIVGGVLYIKGSGCVNNLSEVGYSGQTNTIFVEDDVLIHENAFACQDIDFYDQEENLHYLILPAEWKKRIIWNDPGDTELIPDYTNLMILGKSTEVKVVFASLSLVEAVVPDYATVIGEESFSCHWRELDKSSSLLSVIVPKGIKEIEERAFTDCTDLQIVFIAAEIAKIPGEAFRGCRNLEVVSIPDTVRHIGYSAFENCSSLRAIQLPDGLLSIEQYAFEATNIQELFVPDSVQDIGTWALGDANVEYHGCLKKEIKLDDEMWPYWTWGGKINGMTAKEWYDSFSEARNTAEWRTILGDFMSNPKVFLQEFHNNPSQFLYDVFCKIDSSYEREVLYTQNDFVTSRHLSSNRQMIFVLLPQQKRHIMEGCAVAWHQAEDEPIDIVVYYISQNSKLCLITALPNNWAVHYGVKQDIVCGVIDAIIESHGNKFGDTAVVID